MASQYEDFVEYLKNNEDVRVRLYDAVEDDIVNAARNAGFTISKRDIKDFVDRYCKNKDLIGGGTWGG